MLSVSALTETIVLYYANDNNISKTHLFYIAYGMSIFFVIGLCLIFFNINKK